MTSAKPYDPPSDRPDAGVGAPCITLVSAHEAVAAILRARYENGAPPPLERIGVCSLAPHQQEGARRLLIPLRRWGIALLADDVGMGKTFTVLGVVAASGGPAGMTFVVPAAVRSHWSARLRQAFPADVGRARVVTHGQLSRGTRLSPTSGLVVVDESHAFRNPGTRRYHALAWLSAASPVLLVTATPVVNLLLDLYFQLRLRAGNGTFAALGIGDMRVLFQATAATPRTPPAAFRHLMRELVTARDRRILDETERRRLGFPRLRPLRQLPPVRRQRTELPAMLAGIAALRLPWFGPHAATDAGGATHASSGDARALIRLMLLRRLDSGYAAFHSSVARLASYNQRALDALRSGTLLSPRVAAADGAGAQLSLDALIGVPVPPHLEILPLLDSAAHDAALFRRLRDDAGSAAPDPKLARLLELLAADACKTIVFTCFRDTARAIWLVARGRFRTALLHGSGGALGTEPASRAAVIRTFAPHSNGAPPPRPSLDVRVLIATDAVSEGLNLQDAARVVSYDLPWNPVRLRQRVGRVDRLGSAHAVVESVMFMPDPNLDAQLRLLARLARKREAAGAVRRGARQPGSNARPATQPPADAAIPTSGQFSAWFAAEEQLRSLFRRLEGRLPVEPAGVPNGWPGGAALVAGRIAELPHAPLLLVAVDRGSAQHFWGLQDAAGRWRPLSDDAAATLFEHAMDGRSAAPGRTPAQCRLSPRPEPGDDGAWISAELARLQAELRRQSNRSNFSAPAPGRSTARRPGIEALLARQLRRAVLSAGAEAGPEWAARADALLTRLQAGVNAWQERQLRPFATVQTRLPELLRGVEEVLSADALKPPAAAEGVAAGDTMLTRTPDDDPVVRTAPLTQGGKCASANVIAILVRSGVRPAGDAADRVDPLRDRG